MFKSLNTEVAAELTNLDSVPGVVDVNRMESRGSHIGTEQVAITVKGKTLHTSQATNVDLPRQGSSRQVNLSKDVYDIGKCAPHSAGAVLAVNSQCPDASATGRVDSVEK